MDWLKDEKGIDDSLLDGIWKDLNAAFNGEHAQKEEEKTGKNPDRFEEDINKLLCESLVQNSRICLLPKIGKEMMNITINTMWLWGIILSFHIFSADEVRVYLTYNGLGTRFFIEDIKHYLPMFFVVQRSQEFTSCF
eukprot:TRINITY_DN20407_c0_g1_i1.p1 TRINITY_DN20407_c0_g1~~TRINITY_DN20407_c0_g1_i1.p1  ORF type:complete len:137 (-),score=17.33 TRINITY_DN20407_c0_g1_i1:348-758(-)